MRCRSRYSSLSTFPSVASQKVALMFSSARVACIRRRRSGLRRRLMTYTASTPSLSSSPSWTGSMYACSVLATGNGRPSISASSCSSSSVCRSWASSLPESEESGGGMYP